MDLVEHTGHGIPTIISKYGEGAFEIGESYLNVTIPFDEKVKATITERNNVGLNVGINVGLNKTAEQIIRLILEDPKTTSEILAEKIGVSKRTIERNIKKLMEQNRITRSGSKKTGFWVVIK